jgi:CBS domain-containing protein
LQQLAFFLTDFEAGKCRAEPERGNQTMKLISLIEESLIGISREISPIGKSISEILDSMVSGHPVKSKVETFLQKLEPQIQRGGLTIGPKVSMFHLTIPEISDSRLAIKSMGGQEGILLFFLSTPRTSPKFYLQVAAALRTLASDRDLLVKVKSAEIPSELWELINDSEIDLNPRVEVKNVMRKDIPSVKSDEMLGVVVEQMVFKGMGGLVVTDAAKKVLGVITESDLVRLFLPELMATLGESDHRDSETSQPENIGERYQVKDFMTRSVMCVSEDTPITEVATLMINKKVSRLPVVKEGKLVGIASLHDIIREVLRGWFD